MIKIKGLNVERYIGENIKGHNLDFEYYEDILTRHILYGIKEDGQRVSITLYEEYGECGSGWTTASWGHIKVEDIDKFPPFGYKANENIPAININDTEDDIHRGDGFYNEVFDISYNGGDSYYPSGGYRIDMQFFTKTKRANDKRLVWLFKGKSALGKSFLAGAMQGLKVYETDINEELPEKLEADVVVVGNKYKHTLRDIKKKIIGEHKLIVVDFKEE